MSNRQQWHTNLEIMVPLNNLSNFWRTRGIPLINGKNNIDLNWFKNCVIVATSIKSQNSQ